MKKNKVGAEKSEKNATATSALIKSLVKRDLESLASGGSAASCGGTGICKILLCR